MLSHSISYILRSGMSWALLMRRLPTLCLCIYVYASVYERTFSMDFVSALYVFGLIYAYFAYSYTYTHTIAKWFWAPRHSKERASRMRRATVSGTPDQFIQYKLERARWCNFCVGLTGLPASHTPSVVVRLASSQAQRTAPLSHCHRTVSSSYELNIYQSLEKFC